MTDFTADEKYKAILRELKHRRSLYPLLVSRGRMTQEQAKHELEIMTAIGQDYEHELERERLL